jgi:hypothetical protein
MLTIPALAASYDRFEDVGQQTHNIRPTTTPITLDGKISDGEWNADVIEITVGDPGVNWMNWSVNFPDDEISEIIPYHIRYYVTYNQEGLYVGAEITEPSHYCPDGSYENLWTHDCLEVDVSTDANNAIAEGDYSESDMLDRVRTAFALVEDGESDPYSVGYCYTASSYGLYQASSYPLDEDTYCMGREEQVTTYEIFFPWLDLYCEEEPPAEVYINLQLHIADDRYSEYCADGYNNCLGGIRYAVMLTDEEKADYDATATMIMHIFKLTGYEEETGADETNPAEAGDVTAEAVVTDSPVTSSAPAADTDPVTNAPAAAGENPQTEAESGDGEEETTVQPAAESTTGCASVVGMTAVATLVAAAGLVIRKKKDNE